MIRLDNFCAGYNEMIVKNITTTFEEKCLYGILGPNGCGKTTLLRGIMNSGIKTTGRCIYQQEEAGEEKDLSGMNEKGIASIISFLPQIIDIAVGITVKDVLRMAFYKDIHWPGTITKDMYEKLVKTASGMGIYGLLDREYMTLSQGQKQLVLWTRLLLQDTPVVFLDEPDSALDFSRRHELLLGLKKLTKEGRTGLVVLHDPAYALNYCDEILIMKEGRIIRKINPAKDTEAEILLCLREIYPEIMVSRETLGYSVWVKEVDFLGK